MDLSEAIKNKAQKLGFLECAIIPAGYLAEEDPRLHSWLSLGMHGQMAYMERNMDKRLDPGLLFENARSMIIVLQNYFTDETQEDPLAPVLSKYAYGTDYHFVMKDKLHALLEFIQATAGPCTGRPFVDSAPVLERAWARRAGLGWIGKHSNLISLSHGSYFFIGEVVVDIELPYDEPVAVRDHCGNCTRCIDACPTQAIVANRVVDARRCISYQTIELKGDLDPELKGKFAGRVFGCDICQDVCPWNLKAKAHREPAFQAAPRLLSMTRDGWYDMDKAEFGQLFRKSAVKRTGFEGLRRNLTFIEDENAD